MDYWDTYDCQLGRFQNYSGMSKIFVPIIRNAIDALETRFVNQCFPNSGRHVECVTDEDDQPFALLSLMEHYVAESKLRTQAARELLRNGQVEGQYNAYFYWKKTHRTVITKTEQPIVINGVEAPEAGTISVTMEEEISEACPMIEVLHDTDVAIIPQTAASVDEALDAGG